MSTAPHTTEYVVLLTGDEQRWAEATDQEREEVFARHAEFSRLLEERGHTVTGGAELTTAPTARVLRRRGGQLSVTDGPYAEGAEQVGGFYTVRTADLDDLTEICALLVDDEDGGVEIRACVDHGEGS